MTTSVGSYTNSSNLFRFSFCSIKSFKATLLTPDYKSVSSSGSCLVNAPTPAFSSISSYYKYPGQFYTLPQQCQLAIGPSSTSVGCNVTKKQIIIKFLNYYIFQSGDNQLTLCGTLACSIKDLTGRSSCTYTAG